MKKGDGKLVYVCYKHELEELYAKISLEHLDSVLKNREKVSKEKTVKSKKLAK